VEMLRAPEPAEPEDPIVMSTSDPANVYSLTLPGTTIDPLARPRGRGAHVVTIGGAVIMASESRGRRLSIREGVEPAALKRAVDALLEHLTTSRGLERRQDVVIETINGETAASSEWAAVLLESGLRNDGRSLRYYAPIR
jgi:hypothetical protein